MTNTCIKENMQPKKTNCFLESNKLKKQYKITILKSNKWISENTYGCGLWEEKQTENFENKSRCNRSLCFARFYKLRKKTRSNIHKPIGSFNWPEWEETIQLEWLKKWRWNLHKTGFCYILYNEATSSIQLIFSIIRIYNYGVQTI